jgi:CheY-like chemotaxis protein
MVSGSWGRTAGPPTPTARWRASSPRRRRTCTRSIQEYVDASVWPEVDAFLGRQRSVTGERIEVILERAGYTVLPAGNGDEALQASRAWGKQIDVLVTDVVMPGMHGPELAHRLGQERPGMGVLYISGYAEDAVAGGGEFATPGGFLAKPFTADGLTRAVRRAVAAASNLTAES